MKKIWIKENNQYHRKPTHVPEPHGHGILSHAVDLQEPEKGWESEEDIMVDGTKLGLWVRKSVGSVCGFGWGSGRLCCASVNGVITTPRFAHVPPPGTSPP